MSRFPVTSSRDGARFDVLYLFRQRSEDADIFSFISYKVQSLDLPAIPDMKWYAPFISLVQFQSN
jgi:hypothetical protein